MNDQTGLEALLKHISALEDSRNEALAQEQPPATLYHYTSPAGLLGIIESGTLWLTNAAFLDDPNEVTYAHELAIECIKTVCGPQIDPRLNTFIQHVLTNSADLHRFMKVFYVACLSERGDDLSQWRAYCPSGGYAIGFDASALDKALSAQGLTLRRVIYDETEQKRLLTDGLKETLLNRGRARAHFSGVSDFDYDVEWALSAARTFERYLTYFKVPAFAVENEWRTAGRTDFPTPLFRTGKSGGLVPYQYVQIDVSAVITEVVVSPFQIVDLHSHALTLLLARDALLPKVKIIDPRYHL